jgi:hypothetical protein
MIVIPMLGRSSRFFNSGYTIPKYQLPLGDETVFTKSVRSFQYYFKELPFLFLVRNDNGARSFVSEEVKQLGITDFRIIEFNIETRGQAESVFLGTRDYTDCLQMVIFNIDTIRHNFKMPKLDQMGDGFLEVFEGDGDGWSFVEPGENNTVIRTAEKKRISKLCSNGIYGFSELGIFRKAFLEYQKLNLSVNGELYIAPLYNHLIESKMDVRYRLIDLNKIDHCGIPSDYETLKKKYLKAIDK